MQSLVIVSVFGRGHALAVEMARRGIATSLIEVTGTLGNWILEDVEGPFGLFQDEELTPTQSEWLAQTDVLFPAPLGLVVWCDRGPIELRGPTWHLHEKTFVPHLSSLSAHWGQGVRGVATKPLDLQKVLQVRHSTRNGFASSVEWCRKNGVKVWDRAQIVDLSLPQKHLLQGLEIRNEAEQRTHLVTADHFVWCLSEEETRFAVGADSCQQIFARSKSEPEWTWERYRLSFKAESGREEIPELVWILRDWQIPWTHENSLILRRTPSTEFFDAWVLMAAAQRFNRNYLQDLGARVLQHLHFRFPTLGVEIVHPPLSFEAGKDQLGPMRHPVYERASNVKGRLQNVEIDCAETRGGLTLNHQLRHQRELGRQIYALWEKAKLKREKQNDRTLHAP